MRSGRKRQPASQEVIEIDDEDEPEPTQPQPTRRRARRAGVGPSQPAAEPAAEAAEEEAGPSAAAATPLAAPVDERAEIRHMQERIDEYLESAAAAALASRDGLSEMELDKLVREVMRFMLFRQGEKPDVPVPRGDLSKLTAASRKGARAGGYVIRLAQARFAKTMGLEMREIKVASAKGPQDEGSQFYVLRSLVPGRLLAAHVALPEEAALRGLEFTVLAMVAMNGEKIAEEELWRQLEELGLERSSGREGVHPLFQRVEERLKHMVTKRYLKLTKSKGPEGTTMVYELGANATDELTLPVLNDFVERMFNTIGTAV